MSEPHVDSGARAGGWMDLYKLHFRGSLTQGHDGRWLHYNQKLIMLNGSRREALRKAWKNDAEVYQSSEQPEEAAVTEVGGLITEWHGREGVIFPHFNEPSITKQKFKKVS